MPLSTQLLQRSIIGGAFGILLLSLTTNQIFHGGVWGTLHNKSVKPKVEITHPRFDGNELAFTVYRVEGVDVYGSFLISIALEDENGHILWSRRNDELSTSTGIDIRNEYVAKVKRGKHSLIIPLGSKAEVVLTDEVLAKLPAGQYILRLTDVSGITWEANVQRVFNRTKHH